MAEVLSSTSKSEDEGPSLTVRTFPPPPSDRLPSPPTSKSDEDAARFTLRYFPPPPNERLPSPPAGAIISDTDGSGSAWEGVCRRKPKTISAVTNEARRVLDSFLKRSFAEIQLEPNIIDERRCMPTSKQDRMLIEKLERRLQQLHHLSQAEEQQEESHYVYPHALQTPSKHTMCSCSAQPEVKTSSLQLNKIEPLDTPESCEPTPRERRKTFKLPVDSASSSSTEDYELVDPNEFLARKKKSFFRRATERLMQSFRRRKERQMEVELESPKEEGIPGEHLPGAKPKKKPKRVSQVYLPGIDEKNFSDSTVRNKHEIGNLLSAETPRKGHQHLTKTGSSSGDNNGGVVVSEGEETRCRIRKSPLPWKHKVKLKEEGESDNKGLFDNIIRGIRKGSFKIKRKGTKDHQRSRSADNLTIGPLKKEHEQVLRRYVGTRVAALHAGECSDGTESDNATVRSVHEVVAHRVERHPLPELPQTLVTAPAEESARLKRTDSDDYDEIDEMVPGAGVERVSHSETGGEDELDGMLQQIFQRQHSKPFHERTELEKEVLYEKIAEQLAVIADYYNVKLSSSPLGSPRHTASKPEGQVEERKAADSSNSDKEGKAAMAAAKALQRKKRKWRKQMGIQCKTGMEEDLKDAMLADDSACMTDPTPIVEELVRNASYSKFQQIVSQSIGDEPGWDKIAMMFRLTQTATGLVGMGTAVALQIKEMTLKYFEDRFAGWIVHQGGWESMVEDTNTENDSELD